MGRKDKRPDEGPLVGPARSEREILQWLIYGSTCPSCGKIGMLVHSVERDGGDVAATVGSNCTRCYALGRFRFTAGPGWDDEPAEGDPRLATSEAPSRIIPEPVFRRWIDESLERLDRYPPDDRLGIEDASRNGLRGVSELRKLRRAEGSDLTAEDQQAVRRFAEAFVAVGGQLPPALDWCRA
jgi:hypothetical protein